MDTTYPAATFTATRGELLGDEPLLASAEIARAVCRLADRTISVLAVTAERMRRIDGWLDAVGFVTHAAAPDRGRPLLGSVCDRSRAPGLLGEIIGSLVGGRVDHAACVPIELPALRGLAPATLPNTVEWAVVVSVVVTRDVPTRMLLVGADGLLTAEVDSLEHPVRVDPVEPWQVDARLAELVAAPPRSVRDLLAGD